ncbi:MAG: sodium-translocating pyrophosphatase, partial [Acidimicrobiales bacterium]
LVLMRGVLRADTGTSKMREIAKAIQEGAEAFLARQFKTILIIVVPLAVLIFFTATKVTRPDGTLALSFAQAGIYRVICFLFGAAFSGLTGFIGMSIAVRGNVRTAAAAARGGKMAAALQVAFRTGAVTGMLCVGLGLAGATAIVFIFQNTATSVLIGFGFGASLLALFMRVGGGIFTKAADVGADLVGKVEAGIPEDDPRNAATIADNVGDNVGDCAGMAADLFESYEITIIASLILGYSAFKTLYANNPAVWAKGLIYPLIVASIGILTSAIGIMLVRARSSDKSAMAPINRGFRTSAALTLVGAFLVAQFYVHNLRVFWAVLVGVLLALTASLITEYFTSTEAKPVREVAASTSTGPATTVLSGISLGLESSVWAIIAIAVAIAAAVGLGGSNIDVDLYFVALVGIGMLSTTGMVIAEDSFGPVADNAAGIAEMSGEFHGSAERVMVSLDAVGNTTKAITKGVAIGSAVIASVALFASFIETIGSQLSKLRGITGNALFNNPLTQINVSKPTTFIGLLIGGSIAFLFSALAIRAVGRSAGTVVVEVRRQFREHPGIMDRTEKPEYGRVISICTAAAQRELTTPALLAILSPVIIGFLINYIALGAFLAGTILTGQLMANFLSNSGGAWDNAKKYIEDGFHGGKGSESHKAAVIGDTVGDPFKDTAGPALNPLIKVMNLVSLLILPAVIALRHNDARFIVAGLAIVVLAGAILFSKRSTGTFGEDDTSIEAEVGPAGEGAASPVDTSTREAASA